MIRLFQGLLLVSLLLLAAMRDAWSENVLPTNPIVVAGTVTHEVDGPNMTITQSTPQAIVNYGGFSIGSGNRVDINQPDAQSAFLGRVIGADPSQILGTLTANGYVYLVNPHGIFFGPDSQVNVNGLLASTLDIADADFLSGNLRFTGTGNGAIEALGTITANTVALLAKKVTLSGTMTTDVLAVGSGTAATVSMSMANGNGSVSIDMGDAYVPDALLKIIDSQQANPDVRIHLASQGEVEVSGNLAAGEVVINAVGNITDNSAITDSNIINPGGSGVRLTDGSSVDITDGSLQIANPGTIAIAGGNVTLNAAVAAVGASGITVGSITDSGTITISNIGANTGNIIAVTSSGGLTLTDGTGGSLAVGNLQITSLSIGTTNPLIVDSTGTIQITNPDTITATDGNVTLNLTNAIGINSSIILNGVSDGGTITLTGAGAVAGQNVTIASNGSVSLNSNSSSGTITTSGFTGTGGTITLNLASTGIGSINNNGGNILTPVSSDIFASATIAWHNPVQAALRGAEAVRGASMLMPGIPRELRRDTAMNRGQEPHIQVELEP